MFKVKADIGAGTEYLYGILIQLLGFDKKYAIEDPGYHKIAKIYNSHNVDCDYIAMDDSGIRISELEEKNIDALKGWDWLTSQTKLAVIIILDNIAGRRF